MKNRLFKQVSLLVFCISFSSLPALAAEWGSVFENANKAVEATKFFKDNQSKKDIWRLDEHLGWGLGADKTSKAFDNVEKKISSLQDSAKKSAQDAQKSAKDAMKTFEQGFKGNASMFGGDALNAVKQGITQDIQTKAKDIATGKEAGRLLNERVSREMKEMSRMTSGGGGGFSTLDPANVTVGMFNLDSVFGVNMANGGVRQNDTKSCSAMGLSDAQRGDSLGMACCLKWAMGSGEEGADSGSPSTAKFAGALAICCAMAPDYCASWLDVAQEKAACVNGSLGAGVTMEESWKTCEIECGKKGYGELVHNEKGEYDPQQVEDFLKECYSTVEDKWQPSPTVLSASELAPVVPEDVKNMLK